MIVLASSVVVGLVLVYVWVAYPLLLTALASRRRGDPGQGGEGAPRSEGRGAAAFLTAEALAKAVPRPARLCVAATRQAGAGSRAAPSGPGQTEAERHELPRVAVLFAAHNEEAVISDRLRNLAALDYPSDRLQVYVGTDGSTDRTAAFAREWAAAHPKVRVFASDRRRGKAATLRDLVRGARRGGDPAADCRPEALVFTDANTVFRRDAVRVLVGRLADPGVGGVCGRLVLKPTAPGTIREAAYWEGENRLKALESDVDSCLGANGGIYAVRPELFWAALPENTIADDFVVGMKVREQGSRTVYEGSAVAWEDLPPTVGHEWGRRVRIGAGAFQALGLCRRCLLPRYGAFAWMFWSHKVLRWFTPHLLLVFGGLAVAALAGRGAAGSPLVRTVSLIPAALVLLAAATAGLGALLGSARNRAARPFQMAAYFAAMQAALFAGFLRFCRGNLSGAWERTERRAATGACTSQ